MSLSNTSPQTVDNDSVLDWMRQYQTQKRRCDEENGVLRNIVKRAKADSVNVKQMIGTVADSKLDPDQVLADLRDRIRYMALRKMPVSQIDLFGAAGLDLTVTSKSQSQADEWDAGDAGYRSGRHGAALEDCPYPVGSALYVSWVDNWTRGVSAIAREMGENATVASTARARPARQPDLDGVVTLPLDQNESDTDDSHESGADDLMPYAPSTAGRKAAGRKAAGGKKAASRRKAPSNGATPIRPRKAARGSLLPAH